MNLRKLIMIAIFIATVFCVSSLINGWPKTAIATGAIVVVLSVFFIVMENLVRKRMQERE
ncbi:hypothetical protein [Brucella tritici]|uniref:hypothetical protein n=1 Tax=Brucella tritici TaxID=94626 RepID=UPI003D6CAF90